MDKKEYRILVANCWDCKYLESFDKKNETISCTVFIDDAAVFKIKRSAEAMVKKLKNAVGRNLSFSIEY